ncbi:HPr(Ser) kinase/phosphatase [bacterium endosymbiont of Escarpia laminata]|nr:MAG: HPr(Ser) kinase/phosphatase [bacterium endosymbiont of Escarpia laminata]
MNPPVTLYDLISQYGTELALSWFRGRQPVDRHIHPADEQDDTQPPVGPMNMIRPNRIQVIGPQEQRHLQSLDESHHRKSLKRLFGANPAAIIFSNSCTPSDDCFQLATKNDIPLLVTPTGDHEIITRLQHLLNQRKSETTLVHGVFLEVLGKGVLLSGDAAVGKSELALALISRGHRLVADDATEITCIDDKTLSGSCPPVLKDFLEVRGLGILNIRAMFGNCAVKPRKNLHLIIDLQCLDDDEVAQMDRLQGSHSLKNLLGVDIHQTMLPVAAGRNLAIMVETAVRQHLLRIDGYNAAEDFAQRQRHFIDQQQD